MDCPQCGRTLRVPRLDGKIAPLPELELDLNDSNLAKALDELAAIGQARDEDVLESEPVEQAVAVSAPPVAAPPPPRIMHDAPLPAIPVTVPQPVRPPAPPPSDGSLDKALAVLAAGPAPEAIRPAPSPRFETVPNTGATSSTRLIGGAVLIAVVCFSLGYAIGSRQAGMTTQSSKPATNQPAVAVVKPPAGNGEAQAEATLSGRITYLTQSGDNRPDRGARVIVFPPSRAGLAKLSVAGFRAADEVADMQVAAAGLKALGGAIAVVRDDGTYSLSVTGPGEYQVLVLSHFQSRDADKQLSPRLRSLLESYFDRPDQLLGTLDYHHGQVRHKGAGSEIWDYSFAKQ